MRQAEGREVARVRESDTLVPCELWESLHGLGLPGGSGLVLSDPQQLLCGSERS